MFTLFIYRCGYVFPQYQRFLSHKIRCKQKPNFLLVSISYAVLCGSSAYWGQHKMNSSLQMTFSNAFHKLNCMYFDSKFTEICSLCPTDNDNTTLVQINAWQLGINTGQIHRWNICSFHRLTGQRLYVSSQASWKNVDGRQMLMISRRHWRKFMMITSCEDLFHITGPLCSASTVRWMHCT